MIVTLKKNKKTLESIIVQKYRFEGFPGHYTNHEQKTDWPNQNAKTLRKESSINRLKILFKY